MLFVSWIDVQPIIFWFYSVQTSRGDVNGNVWTNNSKDSQQQGNSRGNTEHIWIVNSCISDADDTERSIQQSALYASLQVWICLAIYWMCQVSLYTFIQNINSLEDDTIIFCSSQLVKDTMKSKVVGVKGLREFVISYFSLCYGKAQYQDTWIM